MKAMCAHGASKCRWRLLHMAVLACLLALAFDVSTAQTVNEEPFQWSFVVGRYQLMGRHPDSSRTYSGTAMIERVGAQLRLTRVIDGKRTNRFGVVRRADPGEAYVLAFQWDERKPQEMVCIIGSDLDNYARLTCHWGLANNPHRQPGMEAYFAQEPWDHFKH